MLRLAFVVTLIVAVCPAAQASSETVTVTARVDAVEGPTELRLDDDRIVLVANIVVPDDAARAAVQAYLDDLLVGQPVQVAYVETIADRYGRYPARIIDRDGADIAETLVGLGLAVVEPRYEPGLDSLFAVETEARELGAGYWGEGVFKVEPAGLVAAEPPRYGLVAGRVLAVGEGSYHAYLNFGENYRDDFTVRLIGDDMPELLSGRTLEAFEDTIIRVRGWIFEANGAMIELEHPRQLQILD